MAEILYENALYNDKIDLVSWHLAGSPPHKRTSTTTTTHEVKYESHAVKYLDLVDLMIILKKKTSEG